MARTISRKHRMDSTFIMRMHSEDIINLKLAAQKVGKDTSAFIRDLLIKEKVLNPL